MVSYTIWYGALVYFSSSTSSPFLKYARLSSGYCTVRTSGSPGSAESS